MSIMDVVVDKDDMTTMVFKARYGSGYVAVLGNDVRHLSEIQQAYTGGDQECFSVECLEKLPWYPACQGKSITEALVSLEKKLTDLIKDDLETWFGSKRHIQWRKVVDHLQEMICQGSYLSFDYEAKSWVDIANVYPEILK